jgi:SET domain-containing protein
MERKRNAGRPFPDYGAARLHPGYDSMRYKRAFRVGRSATGLGLFATERIEKGAFIVEYRGRRIPNAEAARREARGAKYMYELNSRWTIDGSSRRNIARYANHSCRPNAESDIVKGKVILRAIKTIQPGAEITYHYGREYFVLIIKPKGCKCARCSARRKARPPEGR